MNYLQACAPHRGDQEDLGLHQEELVEQRPHHQAGRGAQGHLPGGESAGLFRALCRFVNIVS